jgi:xanthine dehydrogenase accessory factor
MWVDESGRIIGSVTIGGCVDARVIEESSRVIERGRPSLLEMSLGDEDAWALGMTCGGNVEVLVEPVDASQTADPIAAALQVASKEVGAGRRAVIVVPLDGTIDRLVVCEGGGVHGTLESDGLAAAAIAVARDVMHGRGTGIRMVPVSGTEHRLYFEVHAPPLSLIVFGATHVGIALVAMARVLGMRTVVVDGRERFATRERFPDADELLVGMPSEIAQQLTLGPSSLVVLLAHDYKYDLPVLRAVLESDAAYIGLLGSARRGRALLDFLAEEGVSAAQLSRVRVPIGLDIGATTAEEIALSVLSEALAVHRGRAGGPMRDRRPPSPNVSTT